MYISIDMGRSTTRVSSTLDLKDILRISKFTTKDKLEDQKKDITKALLEVSEGSQVKAVSFGFPGLSDNDSGKFIKSANYPQIQGMTFNYFFPEDFKNTKIIVENDAGLGALGEAYFGSGRGRKVVAYLTLSTGVGGSRVYKFKKGYELINAEPGHHIINKDDNLSDGSGIKGTFESYCSGPFFYKRYGQHPDKSADENTWKSYASNLSVGILNTISMWDPEIIVLGGGVSIHNFESFYPFLIKELESQNFFEIPEIKKAYLEDNAGIFGGFVVLKEFGYN